MTILKFTRDFFFEPGIRNFKTDVIEVWSCKIPPKEDEMQTGEKENSDDEDEGELDPVSKLRQSKKKTKKSVLNSVLAIVLLICRMLWFS